MPRSKRTALLALVGAGALIAALVQTLPLLAADDTHTVTLGAVADTTASQVPQDGDNSTKTTLATCPQLCDGNPHGERDTILEFGLTQLPAGASDVHAKLRLYAWRDAATAVSLHPASGGARSTGSWQERPMLSAAVGTHPSVTAGYNEWDVTAVVTGNGTYAFAVLQQTTATRTYWASRENTKSTIRPQLVVTYRSGAADVPSVSPTAGAPSSPSASPSSGPSSSGPSSGPTSSAPSSGSSSGQSGTKGPASSSTSTPSSSAPAGWRLVWSDEFNGAALDTTRWNARNNAYVDYDLACITNRPQNVFVSGGMLTLRATKEPYTCGSQKREYTDAYLDTIGRASFTYGRFEVRAKSPNGPSNSRGLWPAFWLRPNDGGEGEIDVCELPGGSQYYKAATQAIFKNYTPVKQDNRHPFAAGYPGDGFHTYTTEWEKGVVRWYIDGAQVWQRDTTTTSWIEQTLNRPFHLRLNFQTGGWLGNPDATTAFPADFQVDYVRVWQR